MRDRLFSQLIKWWHCDDDFPSLPDFVAVVSFGTQEKTLTLGGIACTELAINTCKKKGKTPVFITGAFTPTAEKFGDIEWRERQKMISEAGFTATFAGNVASTIEECEAIKEIIDKHPKSSKIVNVVVFTEHCHSRRTRLVWRKELRRSLYSVRVISFDTNLLAEKDQPMLMARNRWSWLFINIVVYYLFCIPPIYRYFKRNCKTMRQPTAG